MVRTHQGFARWDVAFAQFGADHASSASTSFLRDVSLLAGYQGVLAMGLILVAVEWRRQRSLALVGFVVLAFGGQFAIAELVKAVVGRGRPDILHLTGFSGSSFPSGHATAAAAMFMAAALLLGRGRTSRVTKAVLVGLAVGLAAAVASTRVLLGVHWFTDVLAGLLLGWAWFAMLLHRLRRPAHAVRRPGRAGRDDRGRGHVRRRALGSLDPRHRARLIRPLAVLAELATKRSRGQVSRDGATLLR